MHRITWLWLFSYPEVLLGSLQSIDLIPQINSSIVTVMQKKYEKGKLSKTMQPGEKKGIRDTKVWRYREADSAKVFTRRYFPLIGALFPSGNSLA